MPRKRMSASSSKSSALADKRKLSKLGTPTAPAPSALKVPGLDYLSPDGVATQLPAFSPTSYAIADPLNPPEDLPQVTEGHHRQATKIYEGASRALDLTGQAMDLTKQKFEVWGKRSDAIASGLNTATKNEQTQQALIELLVQKENTTQAGQRLDLAQYATLKGSEELPHLKGTIDARLEAARIKSEMAAAKNERSQAELDEFRADLEQWKAVEVTR